MMFLLRKYAVVVYSLAPSSFKNISLSMGKTMITGRRAIIIEFRDKKKKNPVRPCQEVGVV
jgi:hypothetical protein